MSAVGLSFDTVPHRKELNASIWGVVYIVTKPKQNLGVFQRIFLHILTEFCSLISLDKYANLVWSVPTKRVTTKIWRCLAEKIWFGQNSFYWKSKLFMEAHTFQYNKIKKLFQVLYFLQRFVQQKMLNKSCFSCPELVMIIIKKGIRTWRNNHSTLKLLLERFCFLLKICISWFCF